jgi:exodeoxyribonuclease VII large subunit
VICTRDSLLDLIRVSQERIQRSARYQLLNCYRLLQEHGLERAETLVRRVMNKRSQQVDDLEFRLRSIPQQLISTQAKRLHDLDCRLKTLDARVQISQARSRWEVAESKLIQRSCSIFWKPKERLASLEAQLCQLNPLAVLNRGYALVKRTDGTVVRSVQQTAEGDALVVQLADGQLNTRVEKAPVPST